MDKFKELLEKLNSVKIIPTNVGCWEDDISDFNEEFYNTNFTDGNGKEIYKTITKEVDDYDRYHEIGITIIKIHGKYLGITHITDFAGYRSLSEYLDKLTFKEMRKTKKTAFI